MNDDQPLRGIFPTRWIPTPEPTNEHAEYVNTRIRQIGAYQVGTIEDARFECEDARHEQKVRITFSQGAIVLEQIPWRLPAAPIYGILPLPPWLKRMCGEP